MNSTRFRHGFVYLLIILAIAVILFSMFARQESPDEWAISEVAAAIREGRVEEITVNDNDLLVVRLTSGKTVQAFKDPSSSAPEQLALFGITPEQIASIRWTNEKNT